MAISREDGSKTFTLEDLEFLEGDCPDSVNPSLWRQAQLNANYTGSSKFVLAFTRFAHLISPILHLLWGDWLDSRALTSAESSKAAFAW